MLAPTVISVENLSKVYDSARSAAAPCPRTSTAGGPASAAGPTPTSRSARRIARTGRRAHLALRDVSFTVQQGDILASSPQRRRQEHPAQDSLPHHCTHLGRNQGQRPRRQLARGRHWVPPRAHRPRKRIPERCHPRHDRAEVTRKLDAIVDFAEVAKFIDTPVKRYSSGMYVRLRLPSQPISILRSGRR